jgi:Ca2+/Na+ antiporter
MILLRFLSMIVGALVLLVPPYFLFPDGPRHGAESGWTVLAGCAGLALVASSFFFIGIAGYHMKRSALLRAVAAVLLTVTFIAMAAVVWRNDVPDMWWMNGLVLCFTAVLFIVFVYPASRQRKHRPMRARELAEPHLAPLARS